LGKALRGIERSKFVVSTKVGRYGDKEFDFSAQRVKKSLNESLERLGLDHVELCICHDVEFGDMDQITSETIPALKELQREGKIKHIGISGLPLDVFKRCFERSKDIDFILSYCHYTMFDTTLQRFWDEKLHGSGIGILNASPLSMGLLTKEGPPSWHPASTNIKDVCRAVASHCDSQGVDIAEMAIKYSLEASFPSSTLVGMKTTKMVEANVSVFDKTFPSDLQEWTSKQFDAIRDKSWPSGRDEYN
jgi:L-galactose dehydrogenase